MKLIKTILLSLGLGVFALVALPATATYALDPLAGVCADNPSSEVCQSTSDDATDFLKTVINTLLFIVGALSVVMIIVAGIYYVTSTGDAGRVARAKNTMTYAIVGLIVALLAYAIVNWILSDVFKLL